MMEPRKQNIHLRIDCYTVSLTILADEEPIYRQAAEMINRVYAKYLKGLPNKAPQELWIYTALEIAVNFNRDARGKDLKPVLDKVQEINNQLAQFLADDKQENNN